MANRGDRAGRGKELLQESDGDGVGCQIEEGSVSSGNEYGLVERIIDGGEDGGVLSEVDLVLEELGAFLVRCEGFDRSGVDLGFSSLGRGEVHGVASLPKDVQGMNELRQV